MEARPTPSNRRALRRIATGAFAALIAITTLSACSAGADAETTAASSAGGTRSIEHVLGSTEVSGHPERIVALEFSFVQALDELGVTPVGIADDDKPDSIEQLLGKNIEYTSVGTRLEPNLELVNSLHPDLIIADEIRHSAIYDQLSQIAPTIVLNSWEGSYQEIKDSVVTIADALGDKASGEQVVADHEARMAEIADEIPADEKRTFLLAVATPDAMTLHTSSAFTGSVFEALGLTPAIESAEATESGVGLERLVAVNPGVLFVATDGPGTVYEEWQQNSAWSGIDAAEDGAVYEVDRNQFARFRGLSTAETIAEDIVQKITGGN
jgi:ABC-type Fe3+-citrate transport system substrate-binding protein